MKTKNPNYWRRESVIVDRFLVVVFPVITGSTGKDRIYDGYPDVSLNLGAAASSTVGRNCSSTSRGSGGAASSSSKASD